MSNVHIFCLKNIYTVTEKKRYPIDPNIKYPQSKILIVISSRLSLWKVNPPEKRNIHSFGISKTTAVRYKYQPFGMVRCSTYSSMSPCLPIVRLNVGRRYNLVVGLVSHWSPFLRCSMFVSLTEKEFYCILEAFSCGSSFLWVSCSAPTDYSSSVAVTPHSTVSGWPSGTTRNICPARARGRGSPFFSAATKVAALTKDCGLCGVVLLSSKLKK